MESASMFPMYMSQTIHHCIHLLLHPQTEEQ
jgi:hypothetical protein